MGYDERRELETRIKEKLANYPDKRVVFPRNENGDVEWKDEAYEEYDFRIYEGSNWFEDDMCLVESMYINEYDELSFDLSWSAKNYEGNLCGEEVLEDVTLELIERRCYTDSQQSCLQEALEFFAEFI
jgi:hypothetical protein